MKSRVVKIGGIDYLSFKLLGLELPTTIPVIIKGSRDEANAWTWNGEIDAPTVRPSVRTQYANKDGEIVIIHYWLNDGICHCLPDCTDGNANKYIPLIELQQQ